MIFKKQIDPDFCKKELTLDIRPLLSSQDNDIEYLDIEKRDPIIPELIISKNIIKINKMEDKFEKNFKNKSIKYLLLKLLLVLFKKLLIALIYLYHIIREKIEAIKRGGINFERKYSDKTLFYLSISLPENAKDVNDVNLYYPLLSQKNCYRILKLRKERTNMFEKVFDKK
ncbi:MAG: hypothetical protein PHR68_04815 [Candidatus Gracilibacteria bacterium]|nr:hypothetical protein [Candidatus Gracilibacteria bacterium]